MDPADGDKQKVLQALAMELVFEILFSITRHGIEGPQKISLLGQITHLLGQIKASTMPSTQEILNLASAKPAEQPEFLSSLLILVQLSQMDLVDTTSEKIFGLIKEGYKEFNGDNEQKFNTKFFSKAVYHAKLQAILGRNQGGGQDGIQRSISPRVLGDLYASLNLQVPENVEEDQEDD
jgi:hypothetical protein